MTDANHSYVKSALAGSWRSSTLLFWAALALVSVPVIGIAVAVGDGFERTTPVSEVPVFELRSQALLIAADATRGVDVTAAAAALAGRAEGIPQAAELAGQARRLSEGDGSPADLAAAADRLLVGPGVSP